MSPLEFSFTVPALLSVAGPHRFVLIIHTNVQQTVQMGFLAKMFSDGCSLNKRVSAWACF